MASRVLHLLGAFTPGRPAMTLSELARHADVPLSTAHRMVAQLVEWGALERHEDGCYRIGLRLWELAALAPRGPGLRERALPYLQDLSQVTRENVQLAVREGTEIVFVEHIAGSTAVPVFTRVGTRFPATGVGLVLIAHAPVAVQDDVLAGAFERFTPHTITDPQLLRRRLADVRATGFAVSDRQVTDDALSVAAPLHDDRGRVVAAVSLVVRYGSTAPQQLVAPLLTTARAISRALVGMPAPSSPSV